MNTFSKQYYTRQKIVYPQHFEDLVQEPQNQVSYITIDKELLYKAAQNLSRTAFQVYLESLFWYHRGEFGFSPAALKNNWDISTKSSQRAWQELEEKGYFQPKNDREFYFFPIPEHNTIEERPKSIGEQNIINVLREHDIKYLYDSSFFSDLQGDYEPLRYDFILLDENDIPYRLIEFNGEQHNRPIEAFGGEETFKRIQKYDKIKDEYALKHNIPLIRIPYHMRDKITISLIMGNKYLVKGE